MRLNRFPIALPAFAPEAAAAATQTPEQIAAAAAAAAATKTPEQQATEKATADKAAADATAAAAETKRKADEAAAASKAPVTYALTLPEKNVHIDETDLEAVKALATANHWTNEEAQAELAARGTAMVALSSKFLEQTKADPDYGGPKFAETERLAQLALQQLRPKGTPRGDAVRRMLDKTGFGNHVEWISLLADIGKSMAEDGSAGIGTGGSASAKTDPAKKLYPNMNP